MRLAAEDLAFGYPERPVGAGAALSLAPGEVLCLLGPNGCGKTTLFKTLLGLLAPQGGRVLLDGDDLTHLPRTEIARRLAYVPQAQAGIFPYSALDIVLMGRTAHGGLFAGPTAEDRKMAQEALDDLGIGELATRDITRLSGGQRQLVVVARAIAQAAPIIVMDEPTASLDFGNQVVVLQKIQRLAARGIGILLSTHDPDHAFAVATRVALMQDGKIVTSGSPADALTARSLRQVYGVDVSIEHLPGGRTICAPCYTQRRSRPPENRLNL
jgi:iron complex transport system ATP-binding protein